MRVCVYIDGANMFYAQKDLGWLFDWVKVKKLIQQKFECNSFRFYTPLKPKEEKQVAQMDRLKKWGFRVFTKTPKMIKGELKANFDVEISTDIILSLLDGWKGNIVICSGDSDFAYLIRVLKKRFNRKVYIYSTKKFLSWELKYLASECLLLENFKDKIFLKNWEKRHLTRASSGSKIRHR